jgi:hypothetical protein
MCLVVLSSFLLSLSFAPAYMIKVSPTFLAAVSTLGLHSYVASGLGLHCIWMTQLQNRCTEWAAQIVAVSYPKLSIAQLHVDIIYLHLGSSLTTSCMLLIHHFRALISCNYHAPLYSISKSVPCYFTFKAGNNRCC